MYLSSNGWGRILDIWMRVEHRGQQDIRVGSTVYWASKLNEITLLYLLRAFMWYRTVAETAVIPNKNEVIS